MLQITCNDEIISSTEIDISQRVNNYNQEYVLVPEDDSIVQKLEYKMSVINPDDLPEEVLDDLNNAAELEPISRMHSKS